MSFAMAFSQPGLSGRRSCGVSRKPAKPQLRGNLVVRNVAMEERTGQQAGSSEAANHLESLKSMSKVVADSGEIEAIRKFKPIDCTTNPSLVLKAVQDPQYNHYLQDAIALAASEGPSDPARPYANIADHLCVAIGRDLLEIIPGRVSTEVDANLSYDTQKTIDKALRLVDLYAKKGVDKERLYIKIASTWEGIRACEELQKQGIDTNMTLLFSFAQAAACADAGATLISPFVGRIMDWYKKKEGRDFAPEEDPGVLSVKRIYQYYKTYNYPTIVMAASFRNAGEIRELAGVDNITIAPKLLAELEDAEGSLERKLWPAMDASADERINLGGASFSLYDQLHGSDQMAVDKLKEGVDSFAADQGKLEALIGAAHAA